MICEVNDRIILIVSVIGVMLVMSVVSGIVSVVSVIVVIVCWRGRVPYLVPPSSTHYMLWSYVFPDIVAR